MTWFVGLDLGQSQDYTAMAAIESIPEETGRILESMTEDGRQVVLEQRAVYHVRFLDRVRGVSYPKLVDRAHSLMRTLQDGYLILDATGVGAAVADMFRSPSTTVSYPVIRVLITSGDHVHLSPFGGFHVPKRDLASTLQVLLQTERIKVSNRLELAEVLRRELMNFRVKVNPSTGMESYESARENDHDDLVLSVALGLWYAQRCGGGVSSMSSWRRPSEGSPEFLAWKQAQYKRAQMDRVRAIKKRERDL